MDQGFDPGRARAHGRDQRGGDRRQAGSADRRKRDHRYQRLGEEPSRRLNAHRPRYSPRVTDPEAEIRHGAKIGRFVVVGELGKGGMGVVYQAHDRELDRHVALKVMRSAAATDEERMRMLREGQAVARTTHPNVITVYEVGVEGGLGFLAQELLDGGTLAEWLRGPPAAAPTLGQFIPAGRGAGAGPA